MGLIPLLPTQKLKINCLWWAVKDIHERLEATGLGGLGYFINEKLI